MRIQQNDECETKSRVVNIRNYSVGYSNVERNDLRTRPSDKSMKMESDVGDWFGKQCDRAIAPSKQTLIVIAGDRMARTGAPLFGQ